MRQEQLEETLENMNTWPSLENCMKIVAKSGT